MSIEFPSYPEQEPAPISAEFQEDEEMRLSIRRELRAKPEELQNLEADLLKAEERLVSIAGSEDAIRSERARAEAYGKGGRIFNIDKLSAQITEERKKINAKIAEIKKKIDDYHRERK